jgi:hypothetical protein
MLSFALRAAVGQRWVDAGKSDVPAQDHAPGCDLVQRMAVGDMVVLAALVEGLHPHRQGVSVAQVRAAAVELAYGQVL